MIPPGTVKEQAGLLHEETSYQQYIQVVERSDGERLLYLNEGVAVHSVWRPDSVLTGGVWDTFLARPAAPRAAIWSGSRSSGTPRERLRARSASTTRRPSVDGVELDPAVSRIGRRYFGMGDNPRLIVHDADARPFLRSTDERYDLIVVDAYHQPYVPFYLATREFFRLVREHLAPGGIVALNVATVPDDKRLVRASGDHAGCGVPAGPRVARAPLQHDRPRPDRAARRDDARAPARARPARRWRHCASSSPSDARPLVPSGRAWTDDRAPVEWVTDRMIVAFAAHGGRLDEDYLPTEPSKCR